MNSRTFGLKAGDIPETIIPQDPPANSPANPPANPYLNKYIRYAYKENKKLIKILSKKNMSLENVKISSYFEGK